ncbi:DNA polymerase III subunit gamma/tau [Beijerinckia indica]|uniref:DNA polymerase III subunit gamma/tau n=1 Tax=Beijerinckia indica subsp. indica (strain ATCC 9039 / DSM 1715 / NCIMB 8712) TaxID=395963 RepID=B2ICM3_BEII9|nr:DNA polymerase III subunit gamma/tau [Beijerinckia indica]ACB93912.1 DNA polymerase III, subunits gamma and tau [Beijerinckia indica subsp. indica ATCC 9039]
MPDERIQNDAAPPSPVSPLIPQASTPKPYLVLARKYRPSRFEDLIGQEAMVKTLSNAFDLDRIHQAYLLTGVRGVGKTTTARILARAFNYEVPAENGQPAIEKPTVHMDRFGVHCQAIIESRHVDIIEMDAASHTGIDDIREIIESARYRPVSARVKVYIIDEVHMLSKQAFNGLLKTLEEPPEHVKFIFATTEIDKVPITVRSRCQRFDLRRIEPAVLIDYLASVCAKENVLIEREALGLIARAAEGSVRDALSLLDQAIAHGTGQADPHSSAQPISATDLQAMLGLADRARIIDLFEAVMRGDMAKALADLKNLHDCGADPAQVLVELAEFVHFVTRLKLSPHTFDAAATPEELSRGGAMAGTLSVMVLTRAWQILTKGLQEVKDSPRPLACADMVLVRLAYAADLPTPDVVLRQLAKTPPSPHGRDGSTDAVSGSRVQPSLPSASGPSLGSPLVTSSRLGAQAATQAASHMAPLAVSAPSLQPGLAQAPAIRLQSFGALVALAGEKRDIQLKTALERDVRLVRFEEGTIEFALAPGASPQLAQTLMRRLQEWTGTRWMVAIASETSGGAAALTLKEQAEKQAAAVRQGIEADPLVRKALSQFPGAQIIAVRPNEAPATVPEDQPFAADSAESDDDVAFPDQFEMDEDR